MRARTARWKIASELSIALLRRVVQDVGRYNVYSQEVGPESDDRSSPWPILPVASVAAGYAFDL